MDVFTLYVGQGSLVGVRVGDEGIIVDAHMPECEDVSPEEIRQSLDVYFRRTTVRGLLLTGFDADHAHPAGIDWLLERFQPDWIMYPRYFKETDCATEVFNHINRHEKRRSNTARPLTRHSVRLDRLDSREIVGLGDHFSLELFSPHVEDMDSSNNCSIVARIVGRDSTGFSYLVTGDTEVERWFRISALFGTAIASDVMAAPHHGAVSGTNPKTLLDVSPNTVLISAGVDSQFDHPSPAAIAAYSRVAKHVFATNAGDQPLCLLTRRAGNDFNTQTFRHAVVQAA
jgi:beta-lactamase superfamily II metal-dependent hydrolase